MAQNRVITQRVSPFKSSSRMIVQKSLKNGLKSMGVEGVTSGKKVSRLVRKTKTVAKRDI